MRFAVVGRTIQRELSLRDRLLRWHACEFRDSVWPAEDVPLGNETMVLRESNWRLPLDAHVAFWQRRRRRFWR